MKKKILLSVFVLVIGILFIFVYENLPFKIPCVFEEITGFYCPGCGVTRMVFALLHGDIRQAIAYNSFVMVLMPFIIVFALNRYYCWLKNKKDYWMKRIPDWIWYLLIIFAILFGILRNMDTFSFLEPHKI